MACPDLNMSFENNYLNALNKVTNYNIIEDTLFLIKGERPVLIFIAK
jgi:heat shock protein HslJ